MSVLPPQPSFPERMSFAPCTSRQPWASLRSDLHGAGDGGLGRSEHQPALPGQFFFLSSTLCTALSQSIPLSLKRGPHKPLPTPCPSFHPLANHPDCFLSSTHALALLPLVPQALHSPHTHCFGDQSCPLGGPETKWMLKLGFLAPCHALTVVLVHNRGWLLCFLKAKGCCSALPGNIRMQPVRSPSWAGLAESLTDALLEVGIIYHPGMGFLLHCVSSCHLARTPFSRA